MSNSHQLPSRTDRSLEPTALKKAGRYTASISSVRSATINSSGRIEIPIVFTNNEGYTIGYIPIGYYALPWSECSEETRSTHDCIKGYARNRATGAFVLGRSVKTGELKLLDMLHDASPNPLKSISDLDSLEGETFEIEVKGYSGVSVGYRVEGIYAPRKSKPSSSKVFDHSEDEFPF